MLNDLRSGDRRPESEVLSEKFIPPKIKITMNYRLLFTVYFFGLPSSVSGLFLPLSIYRLLVLLNVHSFKNHP